MTENLQIPKSELSQIYGLVEEEINNLKQLYDVESLDRDIIIDKLIEVLTLQKDYGDDQTSKRVKWKNDWESNNCISPSWVILSPEDEALQNPLVLNEIMKYCSSSQLKICRGINSTWRQLSTKMLLKQGSLDMTIEYDEKYDTYFLKKKENKVTATTLEMIMDLIGKSKIFPCTSFHIKRGLYMNSIFSKFLTFYGPQIKSLKLDFLQTASNKELCALREVLFEEAPNIEILQIERVPSTWKNGLWESSSFGTTLPKLKVISFRYGPTAEQLVFFNHLVRAAINLEQLGSGEPPDIVLTLPMAGAAIDSNRTDLIQGLGITIDITQLHLYEQVAICHPQLAKLQILGCFTSILGVDSILVSRLAKALTEMFKSSVSTMIKLTIEFMLDRLPSEFVIPQMSKLKGLVLTFNDYQTSQQPYTILPKSIVISTTFPVLKCLKLDFSTRSYEEDKWDTFDNVFPFLDAVPTVKYLELVQIPVTSWYENLAKLFPKLRNLVVKKITKLTMSGRQLFEHFKMIKTLKLEILCLHYVQNRFPQLESTLSGFSKNVVQKLHEYRPIPNLEKRRKQPSLLDLKSLKNLEITFVGVKSPGWKLLTHVSGKYIFSLRPNLKVKIVGKDCLRESFLQIFHDISPLVEIAV